MQTPRHPRPPIRLISRLDVKGPNVIKGIQFDGHRVLGTPEYFADLLYAQGIDEIIFQDAVASLYQRNGLHDVIRRTAERVFIPLTVAGGIRSVGDIRACLQAGADKVAINTAAISDPELIRRAAGAFGSQCIVASLEAYRYGDGRCEVWTDYGRQETGVDAFEWAGRVVRLGAGEILLTSINKEGTGRGFDLDLVSRIARSVPVPVIAAGGAGRKEDVSGVAREGGADAVAVASLFQYFYAKPVDSLNMSFNEARLRMGEHIDSGNIDFLKRGYGGFNAIPVTPTSIPDVKEHMASCGLPVRPIAPGLRTLAASSNGGSR